MSGLPTAGASGPVWLDGGLVEWERARLHAASFGLHNAGCVFEGIRVYGGRPFELRRHCERLSASAGALGFELPCGLGELERAVLDAVTANGHAEAYVRPVAWQGDEVIGIDPHGTSVHLAALVLPWPERPRASGVTLAQSRWRRAPADVLPPGAKASCHYVTGALALREARAAGCDDALLLDRRGYVAEASGANLFVVRGGAVLTPIADVALDGITRQTVIALARRRGLTVREERLLPEDLRAADELFLTGTACEVQPVAAALGAALPEENPVTRSLIAAYRELTRAG